MGVASSHRARRESRERCCRDLLKRSTIEQGRTGKTCPGDFVGYAFRAMTAQRFLQSLGDLQLEESSLDFPTTMIETGPSRLPASVSVVSRTPVLPRMHAGSVTDVTTAMVL